MFKRLKGFTMMELIVVMAIIGVLCGVLVPNVIFYIRDAKLKTCNSEAKTVFNTAVTVLQDYQLEGKVQDIASDGTNSFEKGDGNPASDKITSKLGSNFGANAVWYVRADASNITDKNSNTINVSFALYGDNDTTKCIGRYPVPANQYSNTDYNSLKGSIASPVEGTADAIYDGN